MAKTRFQHSQYQAPRKVSVWGGRFPDADAFVSYLDVRAPEGKPMASGFLKDVRLGDYDLEAAEAVHGDIDASLIRVSHGRSFASKVRRTLPDGGKINALYVIFDIDGSKARIVEQSRMQLLGVFDYEIG
ncbi:immunity 22 family protein [Jonesia quinghaiensis]|uniref:immunity 22 family protein n=1 Tax=Jonesia quinghaiensis TaxID=262806 RepID=UPI00048D78D5|nr:immunity 22 family protein [Jonesia quinghaiensis]